MKIEYTRNVWITGPQNVLPLLDDLEGNIDNYTSLNKHEGMESVGWIKLGTAHITLDVDLGQAQLKGVAAKLLAEKIEEVDKEYAETRAKLTEALRNLQSLEYAPVPADQESDNVEDIFPIEEKSNGEILREQGYTCLITGCGFDYAGHHYHGDLWWNQATANYGFNHTGFILDKPFDDKMLTVDPDDKGDVEVINDRLFLVPSNHGNLNEAARDYLQYP